MSSLIPALHVGAVNTRGGWAVDYQPWRGQANCVGVNPELFFPVPGASAAQAKRICRGCPVIRECFTWAIEHCEEGVWGGTTYRQRRRIRARTDSLTSRQKQQRADIVEALKLKRAGLTTTEIAERMGVRRDSVSRWFAVHRQREEGAA